MFGICPALAPIRILPLPIHFFDRNATLITRFLSPKLSSFRKGFLRMRSTYLSIASMVSVLLRFAFSIFIMFNYLGHFFPRQISLQYIFIFIKVLCSALVIYLVLFILPSHTYCLTETYLDKLLKHLTRELILKNLQLQCSTDWKTFHRNEKLLHFTFFV